MLLMNIILLLLSQFRAQQCMGQIYGLKNFKRNSENSPCADKKFGSPDIKCEIRDFQIWFHPLSWGCALQPLGICDHAQSKFELNNQWSSLKTLSSTRKSPFLTRVWSPASSASSQIQTRDPHIRGCAL